MQIPGNPLNVKSLALSFADPHPHYDLEIYNQDQTKPSLKSNGPIGLDGVYRGLPHTEEGDAARNRSNRSIERLPRFAEKPKAHSAKLMEASVLHGRNL
jgi:hypothetical protein